jgi:hypothetical protein
MVCAISIPEKGTTIPQSHDQLKNSVFAQFCEYLNSETGSVSWQAKQTAQMILFLQ